MCFYSAWIWIFCIKYFKTDLISTYLCQPFFSMKHFRCILAIYQLSLLDIHISHHNQFSYPCLNIHCRHSLEDSLERALLPPLTAVIAFVDSHHNLELLLNSDQESAELWISIFRLCPSHGLNFENLRQPTSSVSLAKLFSFSLG